MTSQRCSVASYRNHPRIRGTNLILFVPLDVPAGSSPHTRDKSEVTLYTIVSHRIIPAYAGQIKTALEAIRKSEDHTRIRGTNSSVVQKVSGSSGSSPHTRDKHDCSIVMVRNLGIIPAYAGQTNRPHLLEFLLKDHPRIRGTNFLLLHLLRLRVGSSPHTRDKHMLTITGFIVQGIIPAYAGQTS